MSKNKYTFLVTGGAGFVGSNLIKKLSELYENSQIISLDNYFTGVPENEIQGNPNIRYIKGSTVDIYKIWEEYGLPVPNTVFHLGEYARIVQSFDDIDMTWEYNLHGTKEVVKFCNEHKCRIVYAGSSSKFGNDGHDENLSPYAWTKAKNIEYIKNFSEWFGLDYVITYFFNVYGAGQIRKGHYATVIGIFESLYLEGKPLTVVSPGIQTRDFTHIDDIIEGIIVCYQKGSGDGYLIGSGKAHTLIEVAEMFGNGYEMMPERQGERMFGVADNSKVRRLGWSPKMKLANYIEEFKEQNS